MTTPTQPLTKEEMEKIPGQCLAARLLHGGVDILCNCCLNRIRLLSEVERLQQENAQHEENWMKRTQVEEETRTKERKTIERQRGEIERLQEKIKLYETNTGWGFAAEKTQEIQRLHFQMSRLESLLQRKDELIKKAEEMAREVANDSGGPTGAIMTTHEIVSKQLWERMYKFGTTARSWLSSLHKHRLDELTRLGQEVEK